MSRSTADRSTPAAPGHKAHLDWLMFGVRYVVPGAIVLAGVIVMAFGSEVDLEGGAGIVSAGLAVYLANWLYRVAAYSNHEREYEEAARAYLGAHGHWPDQRPPQRGASRSKPPQRGVSRSKPPRSGGL